jgi:cob(I)alamin adenosyltransferase
MLKSIFTSVKEQSDSKLMVAKPENRNSQNFGLLRDLNGNELTGSDVSHHLQKVDDDEDDTVDAVGFGLETTDGEIVKVYVKADEAEAFEKRMSQLLGEIDDIEEAIETLSDEFDIVSVIRPDEEDLEDLENSEDEPNDKEDIDSLKGKLDEPLSDDEIAGELEAELEDEEKEKKAKDDKAKDEKDEKKSDDDEEDPKKDDKKSDDETEKEADAEKNDDSEEEDFDFEIDGGEEDEQRADDPDEEQKEEGDEEQTDDEEEQTDKADEKPKKDGEKPKKNVKPKAKKEVKESLMSIVESKHGTIAASGGEDLFSMPLSKEEREIEKIFTSPLQQLIYRVVLLLGVSANTIGIRKHKVRKSVKSVSTQILNNPQIRNLLFKLGKELSTRRDQIDKIEEAKVDVNIKDQLSTELSKKIYNLIIALGIPEFLLIYKKTEFKNRIRNLTKIASKHTRIKVYIFMLNDLMKTVKDDQLDEGLASIFNNEKEKVLITEKKTIFTEMIKADDYAKLGEWNVINIGEVGGVTLKVKNFSVDLDQNAFSKLQKLISNKDAGVVNTSNGKFNLTPVEDGFVFKKINPDNNDKYPFGILISKKSSKVFTE